MAEEDFKLEDMVDLDGAKEEDINLSFRDLDSIVLSPLKKFEQDKGDDLNKSDMLMNFIQRVHDMFYLFQKKLQEYEGISEYADCEKLKMLSSTKWKNLESADIESTMQVVLDCFQNTFKFIYEKIRLMDNAVVRLRNINEKNADVLKLEELNQRKNQTSCKPDSPEDQCHNIIIDDLKNDKKDLSKQYKKQKERIHLLKIDIEQLKSENSDLEAKNEASAKDNRKFIKEIKEMQDETNSKETENFNKVFKQIKNVCKEIQEINSEIKEQKDNVDRIKFKGLDTKLNSLIESFKDKDFCGQKEIDILREIKLARNEINELRTEYDPDIKSDILEEIKKTRQEVISWKSQFENVIITKDKDLEALRARTGDLNIDLRKKDEELRQQDARFKLKENQFSKNFKDMNISSNEEDYIKQLSEKDDLIQKKDEAMSVILKRSKSLIEENAVLKERINKDEHEVERLNIEVTRLKMEIASQFEEGVELKNQFKTLEENYNKKQSVINNMKEKIIQFNNLDNSVAEINKLKRRVEQSDKEKQSLEQLITSLREKMKERYEDCEKLKKDKLRSEAEFENMKKLNFKKKTEGSFD